MELVPKYSKPSNETTLERVSFNGGIHYDSSIDLRISLGDMPLEDAFLVTLPPHFAQFTLSGFVNQFFPEDQASQKQILDTFDTRTNPDLPDIYASLLDMIVEWRDGDGTLRFFVNNGPEIDLNSNVEDHLYIQHNKNNQPVNGLLLDLVIEQTYDVLAKHVEWGGDKDKLLNWLRGCTLIYFMDKHRFKPPVDSTERDWHFEFVIEDLHSRGIIAANREATAYEITRAGRRFIGHMIAETESYIKHFDVFKDIEYDAELQVIRFDTGRGGDLRVQVYESEGIDTIRAVFLLRLYDGTLDQHKGKWEDGIRAGEFFNPILQPVLDHDRANEELLDWIIESGYAHNEEQAELAREKAAQREILRRVQPD